MNLAILKADLKRDEGYKRYAYQDSRGYWTVAHGICIDERVPGSGIPPDEADLLAEYRLVNKVIPELLRALPWVEHIPEPCQHALANMAYQLGVPKLRKFKKMLRHLERKEYLLAAVEALDSAWAVQTPARAQRMADLFRQAAWDQGVRGG